MNLNKLFFALVLISFTNCSPVIKIIYGIHQPRLMNEKKIQLYLKKQSLDPENNVAIIDKDYLYIINKIKMTFPEIMVFSNMGTYIPYKEYKLCNASAFKFIDSLNSENIYATIDTLNLHPISKTFCSLTGHENINVIEDGIDFYVLIFWTEWTGRLNKGHTLIWEQKAKNNLQAKIKIRKVNCDFQEFWNEEERQKIFKHLDYK